MSDNPLFQPLQLKSLTIKNRILITGHVTYLGEKGVPGDDWFAYHAARVDGGAGLIVTEAARIHPSSVLLDDLINVSNDDCIPGYRRLAEYAHAADCRVFGQLNHAGRSSWGSFDGSRPALYGPSPVADEASHRAPRAMSVEMIDEIITAYAAAADRMKRAGLDGCEILATHGLLPAQFLNPHSNRRTDQYGGSFANRLRFLRQVIAEVRKSVGDDFVVGLRISGEEKQEGGLDLEAVTEIVHALDQEDNVLDYFSLTTGSIAGITGSIYVVPPMMIDAGYSGKLVETLKQKISRPIFVAGRINQPQIASQIIGDGLADMCGMTRATICDPDMPNKAREGRLDEVRACIGCNQACIGHVQQGFSISCIQRPETGRERTYGRVTPAKTPRKVMVIGGGPAGMKAAVTAAARGHDVSLHEKSKRLGGQALSAQLLPGRAEFGGLITNLMQELENTNVKVCLQSEVTAQTVAEQCPDSVVLAIGSSPRTESFEGDDEVHVVGALDVLNGAANVGGRVLIADARCDWVGLGLAEKLTRDGCHVRLAVSGATPGAAIQEDTRNLWIGTLASLGIEVIPYVRLFGGDENTIYLQHIINGEPVICDDVDTLVLASIDVPDSTLETALIDAGLANDIHVIGDCLSPRTAEEAIFEGLKVGHAI